MSDKLHIVIVLNASEPSQYAIKWAMDNFLDPLRHRVTILTVVEPPIQTGYYYAASAALYSPTFVDQVYQKATEEATATVRSYQRILQDRFPEHPNIICDMVVGRGEVRDEIVDFVTNAKADMVIMGSRDMGALKRTFLGSTSDYVLHHCHCPILVVKMGPAAAGEKKG